MTSHVKFMTLRRFWTTLENDHHGDILGQVEEIYSLGRRLTNSLQRANWYIGMSAPFALLLMRIECSEDEVTAIVE